MSKLKAGEVAVWATEIQRLVISGVHIKNEFTAGEQGSASPVLVAQANAPMASSSGSTRSPSGSPRNFLEDVFGHTRETIRRALQAKQGLSGRRHRLWRREAQIFLTAVPAGRID